MNKENNFNLLRLLAAIQVMFFHTIEHFNIKLNYLKYFSSYSGVIIFFTISGYLIYLSLERNKNNIKQYIINRLVRIYPALWLSTIISCLLLVFSGYLKVKEIFNLKMLMYWFGQLTMFQFWTPNILRNYGVGTPNGSLWTITVELQFYFALLLVFTFIKKQKIINLLFIVSIFLNMLIYKNFGKDSVAAKLFFVTVIPYFYNFMIGVYFAKYRDYLMKFIENKVIYWFIIYNLYVYGLKIYPTYYPNIFSLISNILLGILVLSFAFSFKKVSSFLIKDMDISYGIYLYHMLFLNFTMFKYNGGGETLDNKKILFYIVTTILTAVFSYKFMEKPALNYFKNKRGKNDE